LDDDGGDDVERNAAKRERERERNASSASGFFIKVR
jgi:hypothetical protein